MPRPLQVGDLVALVDPVSYGADGYDIRLKDGDSALIEESLPDNWFAIRLHKAPNIVLEFHTSHLRDVAEPVGESPRRRIPYRHALIYPLAIAATLPFFVAHTQSLRVTNNTAQAAADIAPNCLIEHNALRQVSKELLEIREIIGVHNYDADPPTPGWVAGP